MNLFQYFFPLIKTPIIIDVSDLDKDIRNYLCVCIFVNTPEVAGAVLQIALSLIDSLTDPFPKNLQNIITPKTLELGI